MNKEKYIPKPIDTNDVVLPEEEKEYDRNTSIGTLKLIMKLGFTIK